MKLVLGLEYDGTSYYGWQKQRNVVSIQERVEFALSKIAEERISVYCAGRTDTGVHALNQVVHFETYVVRPVSAWILGTNYWLPKNICIRWVRLAHEGFHARFSAISRRYYYIIYNDYLRSAFFIKKSWHYKRFLDVHSMARAAQCLLGEHDFSSFCSSGGQSNSFRRKIYHLHIIRRDQYVLIDIRANAFLYRMVRNIVGSLVEVGCGNRSEQWIYELLKDKNRVLIRGITAPAKGLYLAEIEYPKKFLIPMKII